MDPVQEKRLCDDVSKTAVAVVKHSEILARLDERSLNQDARITRIQSRSMAMAALVSTVFTAIIAALFGWMKPDA